MKTKRNLWQWFVRIIAGYEIAISCILLLLAVVFFSTLEQAEVGLYVVKQRYYDISVFFVQPELKGKLQPIVLPGAYWICAVFTVNLIAGGIMKMSILFWKGNPSGKTLSKRVGKAIGVLISHLSMAFLMIAGAVDYHMSSTTMLEVREGEVNDIGALSDDVVIEVSEVKDGLQENVRVIENKMISDMILNGRKSLFNSRPDKRVFEFKGLPFSLEFGGWYRNCEIHEAKNTREDGDGPIVNGVFIRPREIFTQSEIDRMRSAGKHMINHSGCYANIVDKDGNKTPIVLWGELKHSVTVAIDGKRYGFRIMAKRTKLPFSISLKELEVNKYQGSMQARDYNSYVEYLSDGEERSALIQMNKPLRESGYTVYQAQWLASASEDTRAEKVKEMKEADIPLAFADQHKRTSVYQVVNNPADRWPEYAVYVCGVGLLIHFLMMLGVFVWNSFERKETK